MRAITKAPASGSPITTTPKMMDTAPASASNHSPRMCLRKRIAATTSKTPVMSAHAAITQTSTRTVTCGQSQLTTAAPIPAIGAAYLDRTMNGCCSGQVNVKLLMQLGSCCGAARVMLIVSLSVWMMLMELLVKLVA